MSGTVCQVTLPLCNTTCDLKDQQLLPNYLNVRNIQKFLKQIVPLEKPEGPIYCGLTLQLFPLQIWCPISGCTIQYHFPHMLA